jgi:hypothetical protein
MELLSAIFHEIYLFLAKNKSNQVSLTLKCRPMVKSDDIFRYLGCHTLGSYSQIIHFIALEPTVKKIFSIKISIFYTSAVLKLLQQKLKSQEDAIHKYYKEPLLPPKTVISCSFF